MKQLPSILAAFCVLVAMATVNSSGQTPVPAQHPDLLRFDANWWHRVDSNEQQGFIYGYMDCREPPKASSASIKDYQDAVTKSMDLRRHSMAVTEAIEHAWRTLPSRQVSGGENFSERHGFLDGAWWGSGFQNLPSDPTVADRGYLEGYLECSSPPVKVSSVRAYQKAINKHYESGVHEQDKIANVLEPLLNEHRSDQ